MRKFVAMAVLIATSALGLTTLSAAASPQGSVLAFNFSADTIPPTAGTSYVIAVNTTPVTLKGVVTLQTYFDASRPHRHVVESGSTCIKHVVNGKATCTVVFTTPGTWTVVASFHGLHDGRAVTRSVTTLNVGSSERGSGD